VNDKPHSSTDSGAALRGDYSNAAPDYTIEQDWQRYSREDHDVWRILYERQTQLTREYAAPEFIAGLAALDASPAAIPRIEDTNRVLMHSTGWQIVAVPGLIPDVHFFDHLAQRRFPVTAWIRRRDELDYLVEPDFFHDFFGHVPLLTNPVFARFMQAYGEAGPKAIAAGGLDMLSRLYWYMVEFGLLRTDGKFSVYGAGILSSKGETVYSVSSPKPHRIVFDLERVMRTSYRIDDFQQTYFVIDDFEQLFHAGYDTDFAPLYARYAATKAISPDAVLVTDRLV
jgi:phenylalanine-4-hydroxylase